MECRSLIQNYHRPSSKIPQKFPFLVASTKDMTSPLLKRLGAKVGVPKKNGTPSLSRCWGFHPHSRSCSLPSVSASSGLCPLSADFLHLTVRLIQWYAQIELRGQLGASLIYKAGSRTARAYVVERLSGKKKENPDFFFLGVVPLHF